MAPNNRRVERSLALYNAVPNLIWSAVSLVPLSMFCYHHLSTKTLCIFSAVSLVPVLFKRSLLDKLQIGRTARIYKLLGVHLVNKVAQNGGLINALMKRQFPNYKTVSSRKQTVTKLISQTYMFEKFHWCCFVFFILVTVAALGQNMFSWAIGLLLINLGYNVYPNFLQQYLRLRLRRR